MHEQNELRGQLLALCFDHIDKGDAFKSAITGFVACIGAAAVCAAVLPPAARERLIDEAEGTLLKHANKRAEEMRSGELDQQLAGH